jgi:hypothetical protein
MQKIIVDINYMRIANIIIAHKNPEQLSDLINQFPEDYYHNWVHIDSKCDLNNFKSILSIPNVTLLPRRSLVWAGFGFVRVTVEAMKIIKESKEKYFYYNLMSGMDFPLRPTKEFYDYLNVSYYSDKREFFHIVDVDENWPAKHRYERYHLIDWTIKGRYFAERIINYFLEKRQYYNGKFIPYGPSGWFTATDEFVTYSLKYFENNPDYLRFMRSVWCPDEMVFNSLIMASPFKEQITNSNLRYIDWSEGNANPKTFKIEDFDAIMSSGMFLARKFDNQVDSQIIDELKKIIKP